MKISDINVKKNKGRFWTPQIKQEPIWGMFLTPKNKRMKEPKKGLIQEPKPTEQITGISILGLKMPTTAQKPAFLTY